MFERLIGLLQLSHLNSTLKDAAIIKIGIIRCEKYELILDLTKETKILDQ